MESELRLGLLGFAERGLRVPAWRRPFGWPREVSWQGHPPRCDKAVVLQG